MNDATQSNWIVPLYPNSVLWKMPLGNPDDRTNQPVNNLLVEYFQQKRIANQGQWRHGKYSGRDSVV